MTTKTDIEQERAAFEAFASKHGLCVTEDGDLYRSHVVAWMWKSWQARAALQSQAPDTVDALSYLKGLEAGQRVALQSQDREDAERYRWLRNRELAEGICIVHIDYWSEDHRGMAHCEVYDGEFLDKAIDHARRIEGDGE